jgi:ribosome maturation factor RimP
MSLVNEQIRRLAERVAASHGLEVVDLESVGGGGKHRTLRVFLERDAAGRAELRERLRALSERAEAGKAAGARVGGLETAAAEGPGALEEPDELDETAEELAGEDIEEDGSDWAEDDADGVTAHGAEDELGDGDAEGGLGDGIELDLVEAGEVAGLTPEEDELAYLRELPTGVPVEQLSGITHGDLERFSRDFGTALDVEDIVPGAEYLLEASSPGLDRVLSKREEFERFAGQLCKVKTFTPVDGSRTWQGHVGPMDGERVVLLLPPVKASKGKKGKKQESAAPLEQVEIALENIEKARLVPEF